MNIGKIPKLRNRVHLGQMLDDVWTLSDEFPVVSLKAKTERGRR